MILDTLEHADRYAGLAPGLERAFRFLREADLDALEPGSHDIEGRRVYVDVIHAPARTRDQVKLEAHRRHLDLQFLLEGDESLGWKPLEECAQPLGDYDPAKDRTNYADEPALWFKLPPRTVALFFPEDAHAAMLGTGDLRKVVVKVALE